jgi:predicted transcriptional regulator of viral defense system
MLETDKTVENKIKNIANKRNGYFFAREAAAKGVSRWSLAGLVNLERIKKVSYGLYSLPDIIPDPLYIMQLQSPKAILSHETALFLNGYSDQVPFKYTVAVPNGYISKKLSAEYDVRHVSKEFSEKGISIVKSDLGNDLKVYCIERTLCDLLHRPSVLDKGRFISAIQQYLKSSHKDILRLVRFAQILHVEKKLLPYLEVLQ